MRYNSSCTAQNPKNAAKLPDFAPLRGKKHAVQLRGLRAAPLSAILPPDVHPEPLPRGGARFALNPFFSGGATMSLIHRLTLGYLRLRNRRAELDEKALLIALFVIAAIVGLSPLGSAIANKFNQMAQTLK
jgi:hypothetical protein